jgi:SAM-dependent methyltransferase
VTGALNGYGDRRILAGDTGHGVDVASQRADALDEAAVADVARRAAAGARPTAADLGCGRGGQVARMAAAGARVVGFDLDDHAAEVAAAGGLFVRADLRSFAASRAALPLAPWDVVVSQRTIHYLPHGEAAALLRSLAAGRMAPGGGLYLSASGTASELSGGGYPLHLPLAERFAPLSPEMAAKHGILPPVCLYSVEELSALVEACGFRVVRAERSAFGNVKVAALAPGPAGRPD